jgi:hypothetical protein
VIFSGVAISMSIEIKIYFYYTYSITQIGICVNPYILLCSSGTGGLIALNVVAPLSTTVSLAMTISHKP